MHIVFFSQLYFISKSEKNCLMQTFTLISSQHQINISFWHKIFYQISAYQAETHQASAHSSVDATVHLHGEDPGLKPAPGRWHPDWRYQRASHTDLSSALVLGTWDHPLVLQSSQCPEIVICFNFLSTAKSSDLNLRHHIILYPLVVHVLLGTII